MKLVPYEKRKADIEAVIKAADARLSQTANTWLEWPDAKLYLRVSRRSVGNGMFGRHLDIASVEVSPFRRGRGIFKEIREIVESFGYPVYVESVLEKRLRGHLLKHGYQETMHSDVAPSFVKRSTAFTAKISQL